MPARRAPSAILRGLVVTLLGACGSAPPAAAPPVGNSDPGTAAAPERALVGAYRAPHDIEEVCADPAGWCTVRVDDTMVVRDAGDGQLAVEIELIQTNAHSCSFSGTLAPVPGAPAQWRFHDPSSEDGPCTLTLTASADDFLLESDGCRYYCGVRASLDATFPRPGP